VSVNEWNPEGERLGHADKRVVDGGVAMGMQSTHDLANNTGTLYVTAIWAQTHRRHLEKNSALHWLQAIASVRQGSSVNDRIGVFKERTAHFIGYVNIDDSGSFG
jgi:hypothetical protein